MVGPFGGRAAAADSPACQPGQLRVAGGCATRAAARRHVAALVGREMREAGLKAAIVQVDTGTRALLSRGFGQSMAGVPANPRMHFPIGSIAIPHLITVLLQLEEEGVLSIDDKLSKYRPELPGADRITLRMLASATSGYYDWIQGNDAFAEAVLAAPFRQWTVPELLSTAFGRGWACEPGTCFHYSHTGFAVLSQVIAKATGRATGELIRERVLLPLGLRHTQISRLPAMPAPVLHAYTGFRGVYEDSTFWSRAWTIGDATVMSATIGDVARTARAFGSGALLSRAARRERVAPVSSGLNLPQVRYGLGVLVSNGWRFQNPMLNGYTGIAAYLPRRRLSVAIVTTTLPRSATSESAFATQLFTTLSAYLSPGQVNLFGAS